MTKRKRASKPDPDEPSDDASVTDDMVHVSADLLAGSPDIFAGKRSESEPAPAESPAAEEPAPDEPALEPVEEPVRPTEASTTLTSSEPPAEERVEPPPPPPPFVNAVPQNYSRQHRGASSTAIGIVLVVIGLFALVVVASGVDLTESGWPLFIIIPGITLMVVGFVSLGAVATIPGSILTMLGLVFAYASAYGRWAILFYAWALVVPFGIGLGMYLQALRDRDHGALHAGRTLMFVGAMIFLIGFVLLESIFGISGRDTFGQVGKDALPALLILVGVIILVRSVQRNRQPRS